MIVKITPHEPLMFCATDAGGARNLGPIAAAAGPGSIVIASETTVPLFAEFGVASRTATIGDFAAATALMERERPRILVCGTSRYIGGERLLTAAAQARGVPSVAVLDEWYGYRARFAGEDGALSFLPDLVCCPDQAACEEAGSDGLPASRLLVTGSPALATLAERIAVFAADPPRIPDVWGDRAAGLRILFLSETHLADYGSGPDRPGPLGAWLGYTERDVRTMLARVLVKSGLRCSIVEKLHPSESDAPSPPAASLTWHVARQVPLWPLLWHADLVIGMGSMALLEAALMGHRALSLQPNLQGADRCTAARLGLADRARSEVDLADWLRSPPARGAARRPAFADGRAARNVLEAALRLAPGRAVRSATVSS